MRCNHLRRLPSVTIKVRSSKSNNALLSTSRMTFPTHCKKRNLKLNSNQQCNKSRIWLTRRGQILKKCAFFANNWPKWANRFKSWNLRKISGKVEPKSWQPTIWALLKSWKLVSTQSKRMPQWALRLPRTSFRQNWELLSNFWTFLAEG